MNIELHRCFDIHEDIPDLDEAKVIEQLIEHMRLCINTAIADGTVWPNDETPDISTSFEFKQQVERALRAPTWSRAVASVIKTPRVYKFFMRTTKDSWSRLRGEVSIQELFAIDAIRATCPFESNAIIKTIESILDASRLSRTTLEHRKKEAEKEEEIARERLEKMEVSSDVGADRRAIIELIDGLVRGHYAGDSAKQSVTSGDNWKRYWDRLKNRDIITDDIRDQLVLGDLRAYLRSGDSASIIKGISLSGYVDVFEQFAEWLTVDWVRFSGLYADLIDADVARNLKSKRFDEGKGYFPLWRIWLRVDPCHRRDTDTKNENYNGFIDCPRAIKNRTDGGDVLAWVSGRVNAAIQVSLALVNEIYYYHSGSPGGTSFLNGPQVEQLRHAIVDHCRNLGQIADWWLTVLLPGQPYTLYHLMYHVAGQDQNPILNAPKDWEWAMVPLIHSCKKNWPLIAPMLLFLISKSYESTDKRGNHMSGSRFDLEAAEAFCSNNKKTLGDLLATLTAQPASGIDLPPRERAMCTEIYLGITTYLATSTNDA